MLLGKLFSLKEKNYKKIPVNGISFDSRKVKKKDIFFAIDGIKTSGSKFIAEAMSKGASAVVCEKKNKFKNSNSPIIIVKDVRKTLSETCSKFYKKKPKNIIAVTGTNGKSSVADFFYQILQLCKLPVASIGTLGIHSNKFNKKTNLTSMDPLNLHKSLEILDKKKIKNVILEASSHGLDQKRLDGLDIKIGIFTNLSHDHLDYHKNMKAYLKSKMYLFEKLLKKNSQIITDEDNVEFKKIENIAKKKKLKKNTIGLKSGNIQILKNKYRHDNQIVKVSINSKIFITKIPLIGYFQIKNLFMAILAAIKSGANQNKIFDNLKKIKAVTGRLECISKLKNNSRIIVDFAHTPDALEKSLISLKEHFKKDILIVFGCGGDRDKKKRTKMGKIAQKYCRKIFVTDDNPRFENPKKIRKEIIKGCKSKAVDISSRKKAIKVAIKELKSNEILLIAGKGHEKIQDYGKRKKFFSDKDSIIKSIKKKNKILKNDLKFNILKETSKIKNILINTKIRKASINSREIKKNDIFFAIKGKNKNGNKFVDEAFKMGACLAIVNKINKLKKNKQIKVKNSLNFLTKISEIIRQNSLAKIIAITGSCGKTSLKEMLKTTLNKFGQVSYSPNSFNNKYGVPLSLFNLNPNYDYGVYEVGMDKKGEINFLSKIIKPDVGVITNISYAHAKNFENIKQIAMAKSEIINNINTNGYLVLNADDPFFVLHKKIAIKKKLKVFTFSMNKKANIRFKYIKKEKNKFKISIIIDGKNKYFYISNNFKNFIKNILATITIISIYKDPIKLNKNIFYNFNTPEGRGDVSKITYKKKNIYLIDESYNSNPLSLKSAIENFNLIKTNSKKHMILGDMLELGKHSKTLHRKIAPIINATAIDKVNIFGTHIKETFRNIKRSKKGLILNKTSQINDLIKNKLNNNDYLMIKGSNSTGLNKFTNQLKK